MFKLMCDIFIMCFVLSEINLYFLSFHSDFRVHLVFNYYFCRFDTVFCFSFTLVFDIFIVFLVCSSFVVLFARVSRFNHVFTS